MMGYRPPQYRRGLKLKWIDCKNEWKGYRPPQDRRGLKLNLCIILPADRYRPPQYRRGLKLSRTFYFVLFFDIDHPNIEGD